MYVRFPKKWWPYIQEAEKFTEKGNEMFGKLDEIYHDVYFSADQFIKAPENVDWDKLEKTLLNA
jgi:hypothetical protein